MLYSIWVVGMRHRAFAGRPSAKCHPFHPRARRSRCMSSPALAVVYKFWQKKDFGLNHFWQGGGHKVMTTRCEDMAWISRSSRSYSHLYLILLLPILAVPLAAGFGNENWLRRIRYITFTFNDGSNYALWRKRTNIPIPNKNIFV